MLLLSNYTATHIGPVHRQGGPQNTSMHWQTANLCLLNARYHTADSYIRLHREALTCDWTDHNASRSPNIALHSQVSGNTYKWLHESIYYKVLSTQQSAYLYNLITYHQPSRSLRSSSQSLLHVPRAKTDFGRHAFSSAAPQIWNHIPTAIKVSPSLDSFKRHLKTHYFTSPYFFTT